MHGMGVRPCTPLVAAATQCIPSFLRMKTVITGLGRPRDVVLAALASRRHRCPILLL